MFERKLKWGMAVLSLLLVGMLILPGSFYSFFNKDKAKQTEIKMDEIDDHESTLKDFQVNDDGSITSTSDDPWIVINYDEFRIEKPETVNIIISDATNIGEEIPVYSCGSYEHEPIVINVGENYTEFTCGNSDDTAIRFDLTEKSGQTIKLDKIIFNDKSKCGLSFKQELSKYLIVVLLLFVLILGKGFVEKISKLQYLYVAICTFAIRVLFLIRNVNYNINPDRIGDFIAPVSMAGRDWSLLVKHVNYYGYGFKWIYSVFFSITSNPYIIYYCMMLMYAILMSGIAMLVYNIVINDFKIKDKYISIVLAIFMGIIQPGDFKSEPSLYMAGWIACFLLLKAMRERSIKDTYKNAILIAVFLAYTITLHERMIAIVIAFAIILIFCRFKSGQWIVSPAVYYPLQIVLFVVVEKLNALYRIFFWGRANVGNSSVVINTDMFQHNYLQYSNGLLGSKLMTISMASLPQSKFTYFFNPQGLKIAISCIWSNVVTLITQTYGLAWIAIIIGLYLLFLPKLKEKLSEDDMASCVTIWLFGLCVIIIMVGLVINWGSGVYNGSLYNYKGFVYGRYYLNFVYPALVAAVAWLVNHKTKLISWTISAVGFVGIIAGFMIELYPTLLAAYNTYIPNEFTSDTSLYWILIDSVLGDIKKDLILDITVITLIFICMFIARKYIKMYYVTFIACILITIFVNTGHFNFSAPNVTFNNKCYDNTYAFVNDIEENNIDIHDYVIYTDSNAWPLQYMLNEYTIEYGYPTENEAIFISNNAPDYDWEDSIDIYDYKYIDLNGEYFYFKSDKLEKEFKEKEIEYKPITKVIKNVKNETIHIDGVKEKKRILVINDLHIISPSDEVGEEYIDLVNDRYNNMAINSEGEHSSDNWIEMAQEINSYNADLVIMAGDILDYFSEANYMCLKEGLKEIEAPIMYIRSDHDYSLHYTGNKINIDEVMKRHSEIDGNPEVWEKDMGEFTIIGISNSYEEMSEEAYTKVNAILDENKPTIIVTHVPYDTPMDNTFREECFEKRGTYNMWGQQDRYVPGKNMGRYLDRLLAGSTPVKAVIAAHLHFDRNVPLSENITEYVQAPSYEGNIAIFTIE